jgi:cytoskeletal protein CcmA (bactofilin family)
MFGNKNANDNPGKTMSSSSKNDVRGLNTISKGTVIVGNINAEGDLRIEGKVIGTLVCNSKLIISGTGYVEGSIDARNATIEGEIKGNVVTRELLSVDKTGKIYGDIFTQKLVVQMGATFTGTCKMGDAAKDALSKTPQRAADMLNKSKSASLSPKPQASNQNQNQGGNQNKKVSRAG